MSRDYLVFDVDDECSVFTKKELAELRRLDAIGLKRRKKRGAIGSPVCVVDDEGVLYPFAAALKKAEDESYAGDFIVITATVTVSSQQSYTTRYADSMCIACKGLEQA